VDSLPTPGRGGSREGRNALVESAESPNECLSTEQFPAPVARLSSLRRYATLGSLAFGGARGG
jgi:hypothetical protein